MNSRIPAGSIGLALCLVLGACDQAEKASTAPNSDPVVDPASLTSMNREITVLKQKQDDPGEVDAALREILTRYGYQVPPMANPPSKPDLGPLQEEPSAADAGALEKTSALAVWKTVKSFDFSIALAYSRWISVPANGTFTAYTNTFTPADPMLVAFYRTSGDANSTAYTTEIVAFNDDRGDGTRNAYIKWKNTTGSTKTVLLVPFAYSASTTGQTNLTVIDPSGLVRPLGKKPIFASPVKSHTNPGPFPGCLGPVSSRIQLTRELGGGFASALIAVNNQSGRGGFILESEAATQTLALPTVLPGNSSNFLVGVLLDIDELAWEETRFNAIQQDRYSCE